MYVPEGPIDNKSALVQVLVKAWRQTHGKPLPEPMMTQINDTMEIWITGPQ